MTAISWVELDVPFVSADVSPTGVASRAAFGQPAVSQSGGSGVTSYVSWVELEVPPPGAAVAPDGVASRAAVGQPEVRVPVQATSVASRAAVGAPSVLTGPITLPTSVASAAAVGTPTIGGIAQINGFGTLTIDVAVSVQALGVQTRRAVGTPLLTHVTQANPAGVASASAVGSPRVTEGAMVDLTVYGVLSRAAVGQPAVSSSVPAQTASLTGVASRAAIGLPTVSNPVTTETAYPIGRTTRAAVGQPGVTSLDATGQALAQVQMGGGPDGDDDEVGPHRVPKHIKAHAKKREQPKKAVEAAEAAEQSAPTKQITPETAPFVKVKDGILVTPEMLQAIKDEAMRAARLAMEVRQVKESKIVAAAREIGEQKSAARLQRLADLAIQAAEEAEYEPMEREQVKTIEIEDPVTGQPIKATIRSTVAAEED